MAAMTPVFCSESKKVHHDHAVLVEQLRTLDQALDRLHGDSQEFENLAAAKQVQFLAKYLGEELPEHFQREEQTVLALVEQVSPELREFSRAMRREHDDLRHRVEEFGRMAEGIEAAEDMDVALAQLKLEGRILTRELGRHIALEEHELSGFL